MKNEEIRMKNAAPKSLFPILLLIVFIIFYFQLSIFN